MSTKTMQILGTLNKKQIVAQDTAPEDTEVLWVDTSDNTSDAGVVVYNTEQGLSDEQKMQARSNIGAQETLTFDTVPVENSTKPVTSGGVYSALSDAKTYTDQLNDSKVPNTRKVNGKALSSDIVLSASDVNAAASSHNQAASTITAGTFGGQVAANSAGQATGSFLLRNSKVSATEENPTVNGEIVWVRG